MDTYQLDTNVLLRYLTQDRPIETLKACQLFAKAQKGEVKIVISEPVFIETTVTLNNYFKYPRQKIVFLLETLLSPEWITVENTISIYQAVNLYSTTSLDFVDCLLLIRTKEKKHKIFSFDKNLNILATKIT